MIWRRPAIQQISLLAQGLLLAVAATVTASADQPHTKARLIADVGSVRPGTSFTAGILLAMDPGWHTYWVNSGESGLATSIVWSLPAGVRPGTIAWPLPEKTIEAGDILTYSYGGETMLLVPIEVPADLRVSTLRLKARVDWLECKSTCLPGGEDVELALPVLNAVPAKANAEIFARYRSRIPQSHTLASGFGWDHRMEGNRLTLFLFPAGPTPVEKKLLEKADLFAGPIEGYTTGRTSSELRGDTVALTLELSPIGNPRSAIFQGVVVLPDGKEGHRGTVIEFPVGGAGESTTHSGSVLDRTFTGGGFTAGEARSLWLYLVLAVAGGLLLNIMPCVLPVIALKIFGLVKMAGEAHTRVRRLGWFFSLGILASFLLLALTVILLKLAGQQIGWGFQFQEPLFVIAMSAVVFVFGLTLFGVMEIRVPGGAVTGLGSVVSAQEGGKGYAASFWEGVFATVLATPCTAPFLGTALGFAFAQPWWTVILIFAAAAFGMALPYLVLTTRPAWMKYLPKPGAWMESAKQFMGFFMMGTLLWLLYVLGKQLGMEGVIWSAAFLLTVGVSVWIIGRFATLTASRQKVLATWVIAIAVTIGGYFLFLEGILDVRNVIAGTIPASADDAGESAIKWKAFSLAGLDEELRSGRPVFLDFTAEWCLTCKVNEKTVLSDADVIDAIRRSGFVTIKADWTNRNPEITRLLRKFERSGVPLYVLFPAGKPDAPIVLPEVITPAIVLEAIRQAASIH